MSPHGQGSVDNCKTDHVVERPTESDSTAREIVVDVVTDFDCLLQFDCARNCDTAYYTYTYTGCLLTE